MKDGEGERERETRGARPRTPVLMGIISFYLRQLSLHSILISEQRSTVPSKENVCVWKTPSHKQDKGGEHVCVPPIASNLGFVLGGISDSEAGFLDRLMSSIRLLPNVHHMQNQNQKIRAHSYRIKHFDQYGVLKGDIYTFKNKTKKQEVAICWFARQKNVSTSETTSFT